jgi:hypothetical protein
MAVHSKIYLTAKRNFRAGLWSKERIRTLMEAGQLTAAEYEEITGEVYTA